MLHEQAEAARAAMLELFPEGFVEAEREDELQLFAYTDSEGEQCLRQTFERVSVVPVEEGWEERWKAFHRGVRIAELWVGPPWEEAPTDARPVVIDPGRAFGTGAHPTTRLCIELLAGLDRGSLVDLGCGSGVLAIAAARLGFSPVVALDHDPQAIDATERNAAANDVAIEARLADVLVEELPGTSVAVANLSAKLVAAVGPRLRAEAAITSGYFEPNVPQFAGFRRSERRSLEGWAADLYVRE